MRVAVLILSIIGAIGAGFLGSKWLSDHQKNMEMMEKMGLGGAEGIEMAGRLSGKEGAAAEYQALVRSAYGLLAGAAVGLITGVLIFAKKIPPVAGGIILILCSAVPGIFTPKSMVFSGLLIVAGLLALTLKAPRPSLAAVPADDLN